MKQGGRFGTAELEESVVFDLHDFAGFVAAEEVGFGFREIGDEPIEPRFEMRAQTDGFKEFDFLGVGTFVPFIDGLHFHVRGHTAATFS